MRDHTCSAAMVSMYTKIERWQTARAIAVRHFRSTTLTCLIPRHVNDTPIGWRSLHHACQTLKVDGLRPHDDVGHNGSRPLGKSFPDAVALDFRNRTSRASDGQHLVGAQRKLAAGSSGILHQGKDVVRTMALMQKTTSDAREHNALLLIRLTTFVTQTDRTAQNGLDRPHFAATHFVLPETRPQSGGEAPPPFGRVSGAPGPPIQNGRFPILKKLGVPIPKGQLQGRQWTPYAGRRRCQQESAGFAP
jgi:hypothetical protein